MKPRSEREVVVEHAIRSEENLITALKVGAAYEDLCGRVIMRFLEAASGELARKLGKSWVITVCQDTALLAKQWVEFLQAEIQSDCGKFRVILGGDDYHASVWLAVRASDATTDQTRIKEIIDSKYKVGNAHNLSFWWQYLDKAFSNWGDDDGMLLLFQRNEALQYVVDNLAKLCDAIEQALTNISSAPTT